MSNPPVLWAQRSSEDDESKNILIVTIEVSEISKDYTLEFPEDSRLVFKGKTQSYPSAGHTEEAKEYSVDLELFDKVIGEKAKQSLTGKSLTITVPKKELKIEYWPRLTKDKKKLAYIKTDFSKWVDEDEQDGAADVDMPDSAEGMGGMGGMMGGGMPGMGGAGGPGGFDMEALMKQMGGGGMGGGAGGMPDFSSMMGGASPGGDDDSDGDDDLPPLEDASAAGKGKGKSASADDDDMPALEDA